MQGEFCFDFERKCIPDTSFMWEIVFSGNKSWIHLGVLEVLKLQVFGLGQRSLRAAGGRGEVTVA